MEDFQTWMIAGPRSSRNCRWKKQLLMCYLRGLSQPVKSFHFILVLSFIFFCLATCGPCSMSGMQKTAEYDACGSYGDDDGVGFQDYSIDDTSAGSAKEGPLSERTMKGVCINPHSLCAPTTSPGFQRNGHNFEAGPVEVSRRQSASLLSAASTKDSRWPSNKSWSSDYGIFELLNGWTVTCSLNAKDVVDKLSSVETDSANKINLSSCRGPLLTQKNPGFRLDKNFEIMKSGPLDVVISPPLLDWGQNHLFFPSVAFISVANTCNDSVLHIYEPFSTNVQFYPCNFSEFSLGPGEVASICFVFLPRWLGLSSAHLILQTSSGGFLIHVQGYAVESPYGISPLVNHDVTSSGRLSKNLSLFNPFNETLYVKEVTAWISVFQGNISHRTEATCSLETFQDSDEINMLHIRDWLVVRGDQIGFSLTAMRPHENWEIGPCGTGAILEMDFSIESGGKILGAFCFELLRSSLDKADIVMVPLEADIEGKTSYGGIAGSVSLFLEALMPNDFTDTVAVGISLINGASHLFKIVKITEVAVISIFQIKYIEGLLLFPGSVTEVAIITCTQLLIELHASQSEMQKIAKSCKLVVLTNDSSSPQIKIPCEDVIHTCLWRHKDSFIGYDHHSENAETINKRTRQLDSLNLLSQIKELETTEADEFVLENWKSQGTTSGMSVLDYHELLFPMVQVGTHHSKWITVKNPSEQPVVMQLILNSEEIIDECRSTDDLMQTPSSGSFIHTESSTPTMYGFWMAENALTEAYVQPYGKASFGPIFFHPSNRCRWRSSALIRNNLSGVEWLSLRGSGGSFSLVLLEGSDPVQSIDFRLKLPGLLNVSPPFLLDLLFHMGTAYACSQPLSKELYAKNMGDLPVLVRSVQVSGTLCGLDGFMVHSCEGFSLKPGESTRLLISYQTDFSAATVHKDLELALPTGILVIPLEGSLPMYMFNQCKKSLFWLRMKKFSMAVLLAVSLLFLLSCCIFLQVIAFGSQDDYYKNAKGSIPTVRSGGKSSGVLHNQRNSKFSSSVEMDGLLRSTGKDGKSKRASVGKHPGAQDEAQEPGLAVQNARSMLGNNKESNLSYSQQDKETPLPSKTVAVKNADTLEASQPSNLTIRIVKERGKRRRNRKGVNAGLTGLVEVSSSQSGNSTPSSPLSPVASATPKRTWSLSPDMDTIEPRNPFSQVAEKHCGKVSVSDLAFKATVLAPKVSLKTCSKNFSVSDERLPVQGTTNKPALLASATFPAADRAVPNLLYSSPFLASTSTIAPHARAPGSKPYGQKNFKAEKKMEDKYIYDIWGDHFSGVHLMGKDATAMKTIATENNSNSFFIRGPQALMTKSQPISVGCFQQED